MWILWHSSAPCRPLGGTWPAPNKRWPAGCSSARETPPAAEALEQFQVALQLDPRSAAAHTNAGLALAALQRPQEARREFEQAVQLDPANVDAHINLARLLEQLGDATAARSHYQSALLLRPEDPEAQAGLARFKALRPELK
jgi:tetratricopeptide (TPR) repeat protein